MNTPSTRARTRARAASQLLCLLFIGVALSLAAVTVTDAIWNRAREEDAGTTVETQLTQQPARAQRRDFVTLQDIQLVGSSAAAAHLSPRDEGKPYIGAAASGGSNDVMPPVNPVPADATSSVVQYQIDIGELNLPDPRPFSTHTLYGRMVQIADFSNAHIRGVLREVQVQGLYNRALNAVSVNEGAGKTVVDIGGNFGAFSMAVKMKAPKSKLLAFEAMPTNCANLKANMEVNGLTNGWIFTCGALGATDGDILHFAVHPEHSGGASSAFKNPLTDPSFKNHIHYDIPTHKLDTMLEKHGVDHVHALKIDCEARGLI
jgi:FkbM family methyltransferase